MKTTIYDQTSVARKDYDCDACLFARDSHPFDYMTFAERRVVVKARANGWKIKKGQKYVRQFNTDGSYTWTFRAIPEMHDICIKYEMYPDL